MNELEQIFTEMLNHIDDHKESYNKPQWTNEAIVKTWIKTNENKLKNLLISGVVVPKGTFCDCKAPLIRTGNNTNGYCGSCGKDLN